MLDAAIECSKSISRISVYIYIFSTEFENWLSHQLKADFDVTIDHMSINALSYFHIRNRITALAFNVCFHFIIFIRVHFYWYQIHIRLCIYNIFICLVWNVQDIRRQSTPFLFQSHQLGKDVFRFCACINLMCFYDSVNLLRCIRTF